MGKKLKETLKEVREMSETIPEIPECLKEKIEKEVNEQIKSKSEYVKQYNGKIEEFMLQDLQPDNQRLEIEEVARVIVTPVGVEIYTFDDLLYHIELGGTRIKQMEWKEKEGEEPELQEKSKKILTVK